MAYLDDTSVFFETPEKHFSHIRKPLDQLRRHGLKLKLSNCQFLREKTMYLGFVRNGDRIKPDMYKIEVLRVMPKTLRQVRGFIQAIDYYQRLILAFSKLPLDSID